MAEPIKVEAEYQWTFSISEVIKFDETTITVNANTYEQAIKKIRGLKLPQLRTYSDVEEGMKLTQVFEVGYSYEEGQFPEHENKGEEDYEDD